MDQMDVQLQLTILTNTLKRWYGIEVNTLKQFPSSTGKHIYQVTLLNGEHLVLRVVEEAIRTSLVDMANLLLFLEHQHYPAERLLRTQEETLIAIDGDKILVLTTYLSGTQLDHTPVSFQLLGARVAQLHALTTKSTYPLPAASMLPTRELAFAQQQLAGVEHRVSRQDIARYEFLTGALPKLDRGTDLPNTLIHNDCHPANAIVTAPNHITLLDWEGAGLGPAVLDVAFLLTNCDGKTPWDSLSSDVHSLPEVYLQAVITGYRQHHQLSKSELSYLGDAIKFRSLVFGACNFATAITQETDTQFSQWWWHRYCIAEQLADKARKYFAS